MITYKTCSIINCITLLLILIMEVIYKECNINNWVYLIFAPIVLLHLFTTAAVIVKLCKKDKQ